MSDFSGRLVSYGIALESTRGTTVDPQFWVRWETADFEDTGKTALNQSAINVLNKYSGAEVVEEDSAGQLAGKVTDHTIGLLMLAAYGGYSVAAHNGETHVYDHTFTESQLNAAPSLTITRVDPNVTNQFAMCMVNQFELDVKAGDFVRHSTSFVGQPSATKTGITPDFVDETEFIAKHVTVKFNNGAAIPVQSLKLTYTKGVNPYWIIGQNNPDNIFADEVELKGEMVLRYTDQTYKNYRFNNTPQAVTVDIINDGVTIGNSAHPTISLDIPKAFLTEWKADQSLSGIVNQTVTFEGTYDLATGKMISCTLTNTHTGYNPAGVS